MTNAKSVEIEKGIGCFTIIIRPRWYQYFSKHRIIRAAQEIVDKHRAVGTKVDIKFKIGGKIRE